MKILMYQWNAYNVEDICQSLIAMGHIVDCLRYDLSNIEEDDAFKKQLTDCLRSADYAMVMSVNYFPVIAYGCYEAGVPYVSWTCDSPLLALYTRSVFLPTNYLFSFDKSVYYEFMAKGVKNNFYLPLCVDVERLSALPYTEEEKQLYQGEIAFVGSLYEKNSYDGMTNLPDYLRGYFDGVMHAQMEIYGETFLERMITDEIEEELEKHAIRIEGEEYFGGAALIMANTHLGMKLASMERHKILNMLAGEHEVNFYTNSDTSALPRVHNRGKVDYMTQMPQVFRASRINLNITLRNIHTGIPLRVWDILGAGGFVLTNYQPELELYFENGKHLVWFESHEDMMRKADYYLEHEEERRKIARNGHDLVCREHSYRIRLAQMFEILKQNGEGYALRNQ